MKKKVWVWIMCVAVCLYVQASSFQPAKARTAIKKTVWEDSYAGYGTVHSLPAFLPHRSLKKRVSFSDSSNEPDLERTRVPELADVSPDAVPRWDKKADYKSYDSVFGGLLLLELTIEKIESQYKAWQEEARVEMTMLAGRALSDERPLGYIHYIIEELDYLCKILIIERDLHRYSGLEIIKDEEEKDKAFDLFFTLLKDIPSYRDELQAYYDRYIQRILEERAYIQAELVQREQQRLEVEKAAAEAALGIELIGDLAELPGLSRQ